MSEEARAALHRMNRVKRRAAVEGRLARLRGGEAARASLEERFEPLADWAAEGHGYGDEEEHEEGGRLLVN